MATPSLPPITSLPTADEETIKSALDTLFEPSPEIHAIAVPVIQQRRRIPANPGISADLPTPSLSTISKSKPTATVPDDLPFTSYASLIQHIGTLLHQLTSSSSSPSSSSSSSAREKLHKILGSHPRLGAKKVDSAQSRAEQAQLNTNTGPGATDEAERLAALNREYEERFPGLRYVVFVNGRSRDVVMEDMRRRIDRGDIRAEEREGIQAMVDIAMDRAGKLAST
ncbi:Oxo-4-hydroxy-4-carboxy-5-ureidoimidazoline decarboxylase [Xylariaceae sp. AK1471]|nr:Oxo-4-hydroxy-4-carboxy-5-ureidoimidazoline decarboxylase [Xylariaceae sp. AK1471]